MEGLIPIFRVLLGPIQNLRYKKVGGESEVIGTVSVCAVVKHWHESDEISPVL